jgi:NitT/TauT family transport system substrate-binding protein
MLMDHKIDLMALPLPFTANPKVREAARTLFTQGDAMGITQLGMWVARKPFIDKNRAAMTDFMEDALRAERWYFDPKNHAEAVQICVAVTKVPAEQWDSWLFKKDGQAGDYYRNPDGKADIEDIQRSIDTQVKLGVIKQSIDVKQYVDFSLVEDAAKRLK